MDKCYSCGRKFVEEVKDNIKECVCHKWLCGSDVDNTREYDCIQYLCQECYHEMRRKGMVVDRAEREMTPGKLPGKGIKKKRRKQ